MAKLRIPSGDYEIFKKIAELDADQFQELILAIKSIGPSVVKMDVPAILTERIKSIGSDDLKGISRTITRLYALKEDEGDSVQIVSSNVKETIESEKPKNFPFEKLGTLTERIQSILTVESSIGLISKALNVMADHSHIFCGARILSDARPVFDERTDAIAANVIIHTLKVSYHENGEHKEFYAAMSVPDLRVLKNVIERAEKKTESIKSMIQKSGVQYLEDKES